MHYHKWHTMSQWNKTIFFLGLVTLLCCCTPYNSDSANLKLIQGKWILVDVKRDAYDSVEVDYNKQITYLTFEGDTCIQELVDLAESSKYSFTIQNFNLNLYKASALDNSLNISLLTSDSLILSKGNDGTWRYLKIKQ